MPIRIHTKGWRAASAAFRGAEKKTAILAKRILEGGMEEVRSAVAVGDFFDESSGELQGGLWGDDAAVRKGVIEVEGGWNTIVGPVREFGVTPAKQGGWLIEAKWAKALRFPGIVWSSPGRSGGSSGDPGIVYAKSLWFEYSDDQLRPHWGPTMERIWPRIRERLDEAPEAALRNPR